MRKIWIVFCIVSIIAIATYPAFADCGQHDFGSSGVQYYIYSDGRSWNFTAGQDMAVVYIETLSRLAGWYTLTIKVLINGEQKASWSQSVTTTYTNYTHSQGVSFDLTTGDTITYKIQEGLLAHLVGLLPDLIMLSSAILPPPPRQLQLRLPLKTT